jgi:hypothetical protein
MRIERARQSFGADFARPGHGPQEDLAVAEMDTVEHAEGDDGARGVRREGRQSADDPHEEVATA